MSSHADFVKDLWFIVQIIR